MYSIELNRSNNFTLKLILGLVHLCAKHQIIYQGDTNKYDPRYSQVAINRLRVAARVAYEIELAEYHHNREPISQNNHYITKFAKRAEFQL